MSPTPNRLDIQVTRLCPGQMTCTLQNLNAIISHNDLIKLLDNIRLMFQLQRLHTYTHVGVVRFLSYQT